MSEDQAQREGELASEYVETLRQARENFVRKRRAMADLMIPSGAATAHFAPSFADLQAAIEAMDRAIKDEEALPEGYGEEKPERAEEEVVAADAKVVEVDFDQA